MYTRIKAAIILIAPLVFFQCSFSQPAEKKHEPAEQASATAQKSNVYSHTDTSRVNLSDEEWKKILPGEVYYIARMKGTERPWTSKFEKFKGVGTYYCAACGNPLFRSDTKFDSGCGWPSFYEPITKNSVVYLEDNSLGMERTEVECGRCKAHLGHVFNDGPPPTHLRYCINGVILDFAKASAIQKKYTQKVN